MFKHLIGSTLLRYAATFPLPVQRGLIARTFASTPIEANEIQKKKLLDFDGSLWVVRKVQHVKPGKGGAFMQVEMKSLDGEKKLSHRFRSEETVYRAELDPPQFYQLLYTEEDSMHLMHKETFEQIELPVDLIGGEEMKPFLSEGMDIKVEYYNGKPAIVSPPSTGVYEVIDAGYVRADTKNDSPHKQVTLENGYRLTCPGFVKTGDKIVVKLDTLEYADRA
eukprot:gb/GECG01009222.1/.p1 GENE.gb/GECG01009222.1/~~gb/GECG01009222.1/.p1  ORF type:complete len:222 (+),score=28.50 gb/GECG01009222.1/:1-666(+)